MPRYIGVPDRRWRGVRDGSAVACNAGGMVRRRRELPGATAGFFAGPFGNPSREPAMPNPLVLCLIAAYAAISYASGSAALAQQKRAPGQHPTAGAPSDPALLPDQELGRRFTVKAEDLPPPKSGPVVSSRSLTLPYQGQVLRVPEGFTATPFATGLEHPRRLLVLPNGDVIAAEPTVGYL